MPGEASNMEPGLLLIALAVALACASLGGGLYEVSVVDPFWPRRPELIQPARGGISRRRFWIPVHTAFELTLICALVVWWSTSSVRVWLLVALATHAAMRVWSAFDFIPKALALEQAAPDTITEAAARRWTHRSRLRLVLDLVTCGALVMALVEAARFPG
jgi:hypothetical protein